MSNYPLFFTLHKIVMGNGFIVSVEARGKALAVQNEDGFWIFGVNPGGIGGGGENLKESYQEFREGFLSVLYDIAAAASTFEEFKKEAEEVFHSVCEKSEREWTEAVAFVRENHVEADILNLDNKIKADTEAFLNLVEIQRPMAVLNEREDEQQLATAA
ncbi:MAG: hypothetical protein O2807_06175 [bacterium]|nr:hypothetical protein [bacterium]